MSDPTRADVARLHARAEVASPAPTAESGPSGPIDPDAAAAAAVRSLAQRPDRDESGRFVRDNVASMRHGERSLRGSGALVAELAPAKRALAARVRADLALDSEAPATVEALVDAFAEVSLLRRALYARMVEAGGVVTGKGRIRSTLSVYVTALDRELKIAQTLGLERRQRHVDPLDAVHRAVAEARARAGDAA